MEETIIKGTEKQIKWAIKIRMEMLDYLQHIKDGINNNTLEDRELNYALEGLGKVWQELVNKKQIPEDQDCRGELIECIDNIIENIKLEDKCDDFILIGKYCEVGKDEYLNWVATKFYK